MNESFRSWTLADHCSPLTTMTRFIGTSVLVLSLGSTDCWSVMTRIPSSIDVVPGHFGRLSWVDAISVYHPWLYAKLELTCH